MIISQQTYANHKIRRYTNGRNGRTYMKRNLSDLLHQLVLSPSGRLSMTEATRSSMTSLLPATSLVPEFVL